MRHAAFTHDDRLDPVHEHRHVALSELLATVRRWTSVDGPLSVAPALHTTGQCWAACIDGVLAHAGMPRLLSNFEHSEHAFDPRCETLPNMIRARQERDPVTVRASAGALGDVLEERFKGRNGLVGLERARATIVGALFSE